MNTIKISEESLKKFKHDKDVVSNESHTNNPVVTIKVIGKDDYFTFESNGKVVARVSSDFNHIGKYTGVCGNFGMCNNVGLAEALSYIMDCITRQLSYWGIVADFETIK